MFVSGLMLALSPLCGAQAPGGESGALPDAPGVVAGAGAEVAAAPEHGGTASLYTKYIAADQQALPLSASNKVVFGMHDAFSPTTMLLWVLAAGWEQMTNGPPNYGESIFDFTKRVGAAALRDSSSAILVDGVFATIYREDPRYYVLGRGQGRMHRVMYAITRPLVGRTDGGRVAPNLALWSGNYAGVWIANTTYYPDVNHGLTQRLELFGGSLGSTALGNLIQEFLGDFGRRD